MQVLVPSQRPVRSDKMQNRPSANPNLYARLRHILLSSSNLSVSLHVGSISLPLIRFPLLVAGDAWRCMSMTDRPRAE